MSLFFFCLNDSQFHALTLTCNLSLIDQRANYLHYSCILSWCSYIWTSGWFLADSVTIGMIFVDPFVYRSFRASQFPANCLYWELGIEIHRDYSPFLGIRHWLVHCITMKHFGKLRTKNNNHPKKMATDSA